jgi:hypothetical protein
MHTQSCFRMDEWQLLVRKTCVGMLGRESSSGVAHFVLFKSFLSKASKPNVPASASIYVVIMHRTRVDLCVYMCSVIFEKF